MYYRLLLAGLLACAPAAMASAITVANFTTAQTVTVGAGGPDPKTVTGAIADLGSLGGMRDVSLTRSIGGFQTNTVDFLNGILTTSRPILDGGLLRVTYDGNGDNTLQQDGILPVDLSDGGSNSYISFGVRSDGLTQITLTLYSGIGNSSSATLFGPGTGFAVPFTQILIPFTSFAITSGTGTNFTAVTAAVLELDSTGAAGSDTQLTRIAATTAPEPATWTMLLSGLALLGARARKLGKPRA